MNKSDSIVKLAAALCKAQATMKAAPFNATNPFLKNKYADLGSVIETARKPLAENGLSFTQLTIGDAHTIGVETVLMHESGEWLSSTISLDTSDEKGKSSAQVAGSIISYLRRYSLAAIIGIYADEDTDGSKPTPRTVPPTKATGKDALAPEQPEPITGEVQPMPLDQAENVTNSDGVRYGDLDNEKLSHMTKGIAQALKASALEQTRRDELEFKRDAIKTILMARSHRSATQEG